MLKPNIPYHVLLKVESAPDFEALAQKLLAEFEIRNQAECQLWEELCSATWLRRRYEKVRSQLFLEKNQLLNIEEPAPAQKRRIQHLSASILTFHREVEKQKRSIADCRRLLRRVKEDAQFTNLHHLLEAA